MFPAESPLRIRMRVLHLVGPACSKVLFLYVVTAGVSFRKSADAIYHVQRNSWPTAPDGPEPAEDFETVLLPRAMNVSPIT